MSYYALTFSNLRAIQPGHVAIIRVSPGETGAPRRAVEALRRGEAIVFPTDTVYGLGCRIDDERAVRRVYELKGRPLSDPLPVLLADVAQLDEYAREITPAVRRLVARYWPGALTLIVRRSARIPAIVSGGRDTAALRVPGHPLPRALVRALGVPLVGTSANTHGRHAPVTAQHAVYDFGDRVDLVIDGGPAPLGRESTVLDVTRDPPQVVREGAIPSADLAA
jgi:L-threonylcarbamoyladenylate synthase